MMQARLKEEQDRAQEASAVEIRCQAPEPSSASGYTSTIGSAGTVAALRYIAEREMKRQKISGISRHVLGEMKPRLNMRYAGWPKVDGQFLLLAKLGEEGITVNGKPAAGKCSA
jgi:hypothetical protein